MEKQKITFETTMTPMYQMPLGELRTLYVYLALAQYTCLRRPDYNEATLLKQLGTDIKKFLVETQNLCEKFPNNHILNKVQLFFSNHHINLSHVLEQEEV